MAWWHALQAFDATFPPWIAMHAWQGYALAFIIVYLQIGLLPFFFLPANPFLFACGAVWAVAGLNLTLLLIVLWVGAVLGNVTAYHLGHRVGYPVFVRYLKWPKEQTMHQVERFYEEHGTKGFLITFFLPVIRTLAPFWAGVVRMHIGHYYGSTSLGAALWVSVCSLGGFYFGHVPFIQMHLGAISVLGIGIVLLLFIIKKMHAKWVNR